MRGAPGFRNEGRIFHGELMPKRYHEKDVLFAFEFLGVQPQASFDAKAVQAAYKRLIRTVHPDICHGPEASRLTALATQCRNCLLEARPVIRPRQPPPRYTVRWAGTSLIGLPVLRFEVMPRDIIDPAQRLIDRVQHAEPRLTRALVNAVTAAKREAGTIADIAALIDSGRLDEAVDRAVRAGAIAAAEGHAAIYTATGFATADFLTTELGITVGFDQVNTRAVNYMRQARLNLIREWSDAQRQASRLAMTDGIRQGLNPIAQARVFRDSVGLTAHQQRIVLNFQSALQEAHEDSVRALSYELRDHRFDRTIVRAQREGVPITRDRISRMVTRYRERFVKLRAETIARTEALRAVHSANHEAYLQAAEEGHIEETEMVREWVSASDSRVRQSHLDANGQEAGLREPSRSAAPCSDIPETRRRRPGKRSTAAASSLRGSRPWKARHDQRRVPHPAKRHGMDHRRRRGSARSRGADRLPMAVRRTQHHLAGGGGPRPPAARSQADRPRANPPLTGG